MCCLHLLEYEKLQLSLSDICCKFLLPFHLENSESFANMSNFLDMKRVATFTLLCSFTVNDFIDANLWQLNSRTILVFLASGHSSTFESTSLNFLFLLLDFSKDSTAASPSSILFLKYYFLASYVVSFLSRANIFPSKV